MSEAHWTSRSTEDYRYSLSADIRLQIEKEMERQGVSRSVLAKRLGVSRARVTQLLCDGGLPNMTLETIITLSRAVGLKPTVVLYDHGDDPTRAPVPPEVFRLCWEDKKKPRDFWKWSRKRIKSL